MTIKELKECLSTFDENDGFSIVVINREKRLIHNHKKVYFIKEMPAVFIETTKTETFEESRGI